MTSNRWQPVYVGIGSNLDQPALQVRNAMQALLQLSEVVGWLFSRCYASPPMGPQDQPSFVNAVAGGLTRASADTMLGALQRIELAAGRSREGRRWGPRVLDLDLLALGRTRQSDSSLTVPHPGIGERRFVLAPWSDIAAEFEIPGLGTVAQCLRTVPGKATVIATEAA
ncbi:MAG: 2-amino-4-hydroxy-6-hydroxymethyldihydropteridine diphosphokinase [Pseudomonadota bacterium]